MPVAALQRTTKLTVIDQTNETTVVTLSDTEVAVRLERHHTSHGGEANSTKRIIPLAASEPTIDQLSAMSANLKLGSCWAGFSMFGPYGDRVKKDR